MARTPIPQRIPSLRRIVLATAVVAFCVACDANENSGYAPNIDGATPTDSARDDDAFSSRLPLVLSVHFEPKTSRTCDVEGVLCATDEEFSNWRDATDALISVLDANGLKATFQLEIHWLVRLDQDVQGQKTLQKMIEGGHEIGLHHHQYDNKDWDGFSDSPKSQQPHPTYPQLVARPMSEWQGIVDAWQKRTGYRLKTASSPEVYFDWQATWLYRTLADPNPEASIPVIDPLNACNPSESEMQLPSRSGQTSIPAINAEVPTAYYARFVASNAACQLALGNTVLDFARHFDGARGDKLNGVHLLFHLSDYAATKEIQDAYDNFFQAAANSETFEPLTVRDYLCQRMETCL